MALPGQASGDFTESSSALRILYVGTRNTFAAELTTDGFTQTNPPTVTTAGTVSTTLAAAPKRGVLGGSVAFSRPEAGNGYIGGPASIGTSGVLQPLGMFINDAAGNSFENTPAAASGKAPYMSAQGTYGVRLYETHVLVGGGTATATDPLFYATGMKLYASANGFLTSAAGTLAAIDEIDDCAEADTQFGPVANTTLAQCTVIGVATIVPDSVHAELVFDQRI